MLATLLALVALTFLVAKGLSLLAILLIPLDTHPRLRFATIISLTFVVMRYMVHRCTLISGMRATLLGLLDLLRAHRLAYLVVRYVAILALALLPQATTGGGDCYYKAAVIVSLVLLLTMRPSTPVKKPASAGGLDHFIRFSGEMMMGRKMATEKIISGFSLLIEDSKGAIQSFVVHTALILMTPVCVKVFYVFIQ